jgi:hypothetical protein
MDFAFFFLWKFYELPLHFCTARRSALKLLQIHITSILHPQRPLNYSCRPFSLLLMLRHLEDWDLSDVEQMHCIRHIYGWRAGSGLFLPRDPKSDRRYWGSSTPLLFCVTLYNQCKSVITRFVDRDAGAVHRCRRLGHRPVLSK